MMIGGLRKLVNSRWSSPYLGSLPLAGGQRLATKSPRSQCHLEFRCSIRRHGCNGYQLQDGRRESSGSATFVCNGSLDSDVVSQLTVISSAQADFDSFFVFAGPEFDAIGITPQVARCCGGALSGLS